MFSELATELLSKWIRFYLSKEIIGVGNFCSVIINLGLLTITKDTVHRSPRTTRLSAIVKHQHACKCAYMSRVHVNTWQHVTALIIGIFLGGARSVCSLQEAGAEGFFPLSDRARQFSFSLSWGVRKRQPAVPAGASQLLPSPGIPETDHPVQALPSYFQTGCSFVCVS